MNIHWSNKFYLTCLLFYLSVLSVKPWVEQIVLSKWDMNPGLLTHLWPEPSALDHSAMISKFWGVVSDMPSGPMYLKVIRYMEEMVVQFWSIDTDVNRQPWWISQHKSFTYNCHVQYNYSYRTNLMIFKIQDIQER